MNFLTDIPLCLFALIIFAITAASFCWGISLGAKQLGKEGASEPAGSIIGAVMALLAFMLAFTFGLAAGRFDERRLLIVDSANAIGTCYLRTDYLDEPDRSKMRNMLRTYVIACQQVAKGHYKQEDIATANNLLNQMWTIAASLGQKHPTPISALFISSLNDVIDFQEKRVCANLYTRVPQTVWFYLLLVSTLAMVGMGYYCGLNGSRPKAEAIIMVTAYAVVLLLAQDLDRPLGGILQTNYKPLDDVAKQIGVEGFNIH